VQSGEPGAGGGGHRTSSKDTKEKTSIKKKLEVACFATSRKSWDEGVHEGRVDIITSDLKHWRGNKTGLLKKIRSHRLNRRGRSQEEGVNSRGRGGAGGTNQFGNGNYGTRISSQGGRRAKMTTLSIKVRAERQEQ